MHGNQIDFSVIQFTPGDYISEKDLDHSTK